jgi:ferredoxin-fold anticodon binding domain-containing protein
MNKVTFSIGKTINLGNFESGRIDIGVELDVEKESDIEKYFGKAKILVKNQLDQAVKEKLYKFK